MGEWIESLSLKMASFAVLLAIVSLQLAGIAPLWQSLAALFCITVSTMLQNDWRDRAHDVRKGEVLVMEHESAFLGLVVGAWLLSAVLIVATWLVAPRLGVFLACIATVGLVYSEIRRIPFLPICLVAFTAASPALFPAVQGVITLRGWLLYVATVFIIFAREITRDIEDAAIDPGYKWTLPVILGEQAATSLTLAAMLAGVGASVFISAWCVFGAVVAWFGAVPVMRGETQRARKYIDVGMGLVLVTLLVVPYTGFAF